MADRRKPKFTFAGRGAALSAHEPTYRERVQYALSDLFGSLGADKYRAGDVSRRVTDLAEWTPFGMLTGMDDANRAGSAGDYLGMGVAALGAMPMAGKADDVVKKGIRAYHGSPQKGLTKILANPTERQFDNGTSALGAFFAPHEGGAKRYAGDAGQVYSADLNLSNPYEMPVSEFLYLQDPTKGAVADEFGRRASVSDWAARLDELKGEGAALRKRLQDAGHDGVIIRDRSGNILEIASFNDVDLGK